MGILSVLIHHKELVVAFFQLMVCVCVLNVAVCAVSVGVENHSPDDAVYAAWKSRMPAPHGIFHLQARVYVCRLCVDMSLDNLLCNMTVSSIL